MMVTQQPNMVPYSISNTTIVDNGVHHQQVCMIVFRVIPRGLFKGENFGKMLVKIGTEAALAI